MEQKKESGTIHSLQLQSIKQENPNTYSFTFPIPDTFSWKEGACVHLGNSKFDISKGKANKEFVRHLSIASLPDEGVLSFTTRIFESRSEFKNDLQKAKAGDVFTLFKPENRLELRRQGRPVILISAGVGIAATRSQIRAFNLSQEHIPNLFHINIDSSGEYLYQEEINTFVRDTRGFANMFVSTRDQFYNELEKKIQDGAIYYIIGSDDFLVSVGKWLIARDVTESSIILDKNQSFYEELSLAPLAN